jgi:phosphotransferase system  glucose/maltose/N-acetylglucosamine-specific IIC component
VEDLLEYVHDLKLVDRVAPDVAELFEMATGAYVYGFLYRPLMTMGYHYALLAVEAALLATYEQHGGTDKKATMGTTLLYLMDKGLLPMIPSPVHGPGGDFPTAYHLVKQMRDGVFSHPRFATMLGIGGFHIFELCADLINALYP